MIKVDIEQLISEVETAAVLDHSMLVRTAEVLHLVFPNTTFSLEITSDEVEQVLHLVDTALPNWTIQLTGKAMEPDGHWRCSLRESRGSDEDQVVGLGTGAVVGLAVAAALLRVALAKAAH